jgi:hypothetical protein
MVVQFDINLERNEYAAGETAKGTLIISKIRTSRSKVLNSPFLGYLLEPYS